MTTKYPSKAKEQHKVDNKAYEKALKDLNEKTSYKIDEIIQKLESERDRARGMRYVTSLASLDTARTIKDILTQK